MTVNVNIESCHVASRPFSSEDEQRLTESLAAWDLADDEQREVVYEVCQRTLDFMRDNLDQWVPQSLRVENGHTVEVRFNVAFTELDRELPPR